MPIDLADADPRIIVHDRTGTVLPYSRGIMATSLLAAGIRTEEAYRLASLVQARLLHHQRHDVRADELVELATLTLDEHAEDAGVTARWLAWRTARRSGHPIVVVLCGAPGVGKSTFATRLAVRLGITRVVSTDAIREVMRLVVPPVVLPELHDSIFDLVDHSFERFDRQGDGVASATAAVIERYAAEGRSAIVEGVHLRPGALTAHLNGLSTQPAVAERLVTVGHPQLHSEQLGGGVAGELHDDADRHLDRFDAIRAIQEHLRRCADEAGVSAVDSRDTALLTRGIVSEIAAHVGHPVTADR